MRVHLLVSVAGLFAAQSGLSVFGGAQLPEQSTAKLSKGKFLVAGIDDRSVAGAMSPGWTPDGKTGKEQGGTPIMKDLQGKVAFVTGGASGIGLGIVKLFVQNGMKVVIADLRQDHLDEALSCFESRQKRPSVHGIRLDVTDRPAMAAAADETERLFGKVHVVVNNAGVGLEGPLDKASFDDWDFGISVNLVGVVNGVQTFLPRLRRHGEGGHIVNTASLAGMTVMPARMIIYATTKAAVIAMSESLHMELQPSGIGVTVLCPGPIKSNIHEAWKNRPERFKQHTGFKESEGLLGRRIVSDLWMEPERVGEMVIKAIRNDQLYVITHGEWRDAVTARYAAIMAATPKETNPRLIESLRTPQIRAAAE